MTWSIDGKTVLITGATSGIGQATAAELARRGAHVLAVGRDRDSVEAAVERIRAASGNENVQPLHADLSNQAEIRHMVAHVTTRYESLDVLVNNAGVALFKPTQARDGINTMLAVNHVAPFLLTTGLLPIMRRRPEARVITVSSDQHKKVKGVDWTALEQGGTGDGGVTYEQTKLMNMWFTRSLAARLRGSTVTATAVSPGFVKTGLARHAQGGFGFFLKYIAPVFQSNPDKGAATTVVACCSPDMSGLNGSYLANEKVATPGGLVDDMAQAERLWRLTEQLTNPTTTQPSA